MIFLQIRIEFVRPENLQYFQQLIFVVYSLEEVFAAEDHGSEHAADGPHVKAVVIAFVTDEKFGGLVVS
jgi:hypothetical protein